MVYGFNCEEKYSSCPNLIYRSFIQQSFSFYDNCISIVTQLKKSHSHVLIPKTTFEAVVIPILQMSKLGLWKLRHLPRLLKPVSARCHELGARFHTQRSRVVPWHLAAVTYSHAYRGWPGNVHE